MKSHFKYYVIVWVVFIAIFNVIVFVTPNGIAGVSKFDDSFWVGYIFIMLAFVIQLGIAWYSLKDDITKTFYRMPLLPISYVLLIVMLIVGTLCMLIPNFPVWLGIILCLLVLAFSIVSMVQAQTASSVITDIDTKIKNKTFFIKSLTIDIDSLLARAASHEMSEELKKVYEVVRYSDPMSNDALSGIESTITIKVSELSEYAGKDDNEEVKRLVKEIIILLDDRNKKCKLLK